MKVAQVCPFFHPVIGGWETAVLNISKGLIERGHEVTVFTCDEMHDKTKIREREGFAEGVRVKRFPVWFRVSDFYRIWPGFIGELQKGKFDIVHAHNYRHFHCDASAFLKGRGKYKLVLRTGMPFHPKSAQLGMMRGIYDATMPKLLRGRIDGLFVYNNSEKEKFERLGFSGEQISTIPYGVEDLFFEEGNGAKFRRRHSLRSKVVLCAARLHRYKGIETLIKAAAFLGRDDVSMVIAGDGDEKYAQSLLRLCRNMGVEDRVTFVRESISREQLRNAYAACDLFVLPSIYESYGIALLEAMAQGCAVLASRTEGPAGIISEGENGMLFEPGGSAELAQKIGSLIDDGTARARLGRNAKAYAQNLRWEKIVCMIDAEYGKL
ncbi:MAG: glycosyltransferase family 4 protein [Candidatus Diapherotrites archaeon]